MAQLFYGGAIDSLELPDRVLAHFKVVAAMKMRRGESFTVSWRTETGRETLWLQPAIALRFVFPTPEPELLDRAVLGEMMNQANSTNGLTLMWDADGEPAGVVPASSTAAR